MPLGKVVAAVAAVALVLFVLSTCTSSCKGKKPAGGQTTAAQTAETAPEPSKEPEKPQYASLQDYFEKNSASWADWRQMIGNMSAGTLYTVDCSCSGNTFEIDYTAPLASAPTSFGELFFDMAIEGATESDRMSDLRDIAAQLEKESGIDGVIVVCNQYGGDGSLLNSTTATV